MPDGLRLQDFAISEIADVATAREVAHKVGVREATSERPNGNPVCRGDPRRLTALDALATNDRKAPRERAVCRSAYRNCRTDLSRFPESSGPWTSKVYAGLCTRSRGSRAIGVSTSCYRKGSPHPPGCGAVASTQKAAPQTITGWMGGGRRLPTVLVNLRSRARLSRVVRDTLRRTGDGPLISLGHTRTGSSRP